MVADSATVVAIADTTHKIPRDPDGNLIRQPHMSETEWNICQDALKPAKDLPTYLARHYDRVELAQKIAGSRVDDLPQLAKYVVNIVAPPKYDVIDVTPAKED